MATHSSALEAVSDKRGSKTTTFAPFFLPCAKRTARQVETAAMDALLPT